jgi:hypothetical protein
MTGATVLVADDDPVIVAARLALGPRSGWPAAYGGG